MLSGTCPLKLNPAVLINRKQLEANGSADNPRNQFCVGYRYNSQSDNMQKIKEDFPKKEQKVLFIL